MSEDNVQWVPDGEVITEVWNGRGIRVSKRRYQRLRGKHRETYNINWPWIEIGTRTYRELVWAYKHRGFRS